VITPESVKRYEHALAMYRRIEKQSGDLFLHLLDAHTVIGSVKEQNDVYRKHESALFEAFTVMDAPQVPGVKQPFGAYTIKGTGYVHIQRLLQATTARIASGSACTMLREFVEYAELDCHKDHFVYHGFEARQVVFCEGVRAENNPFFPALPFQTCKGEVLTIECEGLPETKIIRKGIFMIPLGNSMFRVGSTYTWNDPDPNPTEAGLAFLREKLNGLTGVPYRVLDHQAAVRPTTSSREAFILQHPDFPGMWMMNGLGSKGVLNGPEMVTRLLARMNDTH
jgi:glycine/D-amino acid oxidase-like deaminating enzyme